MWWINQAPTPSQNLDPIIRIAIIRLISRLWRKASSLVVMPVRNHMRAIRVWAKKVATIITNQNFTIKDPTTNIQSNIPPFLFYPSPRPNTQLRPSLLAPSIKFLSQAQTLTSLITSSLSTNFNKTYPLYLPHGETPSETLKESLRKAEWAKITLKTSYSITSLRQPPPSLSTSKQLQTINEQWALWIRWVPSQKRQSCASKADPRSSTGVFPTKPTIRAITPTT